MNKPIKHVNFDHLEYIGITGLPRRLYSRDLGLRALAMDAALSTAPNSGVPAYLTTYVSPQVIKNLIAPMNAERIFSPVKNGQMGHRTATFPKLELTGEVAAYSDYGAEGSADYNANYPSREAYYFETTTRWGDMEQAIMGLAQLDAANRVNEASALTLKAAHNRFWLFGVAGLKNWGLLNDPDLTPPMAPKPGAKGNTWEEKDPVEIYHDGLALFQRLVVQTAGLVPSGLNMDSPLKLVISNVVSPWLFRANQYGESAALLLKKSFPNLTVEVVPEYSLPSGELVQLIASELEGQATGQLGYTELMHAHGVVRSLSSYQEKKSAGTFGAVIFQPFAIAQMQGV